MYFLREKNLLNDLTAEGTEFLNADGIAANFFNVTLRRRNEGDEACKGKSSEFTWRK